MVMSLSAITCIL